MWSLNGPLLFVVGCCSWRLTNYCNTVVTDNVCYHGCKHGSSLYCSTSCRFGTVTPYWLLINQKKVLNKSQTTVCIIIAIIICIISETVVFSLANKRIFKIRQEKKKRQIFLRFSQKICYVCCSSLFNIYLVSIISQT